METFRRVSAKIFRANSFLFLQQLDLGIESIFQPFEGIRLNSKIYLATKSRLVHFTSYSDREPVRKK